tara:strand:+ start:357 stop:1259 length:903 start_codon:yes stop_codon:yes gene_type:complete
MNNNHNDEVDIKDLLKIISKKKTAILILAILFSLGSFIYSFISPSIYTSSALLMSSNQNDSLSSKLGSYSSLAGLAGVNIPNDSSNPTKEAIARIKSFSFFVNHFLSHIKLENLVAAKNWVKNDNSIIYNKKIYDVSQGKWVESASLLKPSNQEAYQYYLKLLSISEDPKTSFVLIEMDHVSPNIAQEWVDLIIQNINESMREDNERIAIQSIEFLQKTYQETQLTQIQVAITNLLQTQMQNLMLTSANKNFVFKIIDSPFSPEKKSSPGKLTFIIAGLFLGLFLGIAYSLISFFIKDSH